MIYVKSDEPSTIISLALKDKEGDMHQIVVTWREQKQEQPQLGGGWGITRIGIIEAAKVDNPKEMEFRFEMGQRTISAEWGQRFAEMFSMVMRTLDGMMHGEVPMKFPIGMSMQMDEFEMKTDLYRRPITKSELERMGFQNGDEIL